MRLRVRYGKTTVATVDVGLPDGTAQRVLAEIAVQDLLIAGMGDSIAAGEGNPDRPIALDDGGFCFRRFLAGATSEYFRPGRAGFKGNKACEQGFSSGNTAADWARLNARWWSAACHRSLYGYQLRTALALAVEQPHVAVTFLPLACSGTTIELGFFNPLRARECPPTGSCASSHAAANGAAEGGDAISRASITRSASSISILLTIGANDIWFAGLVANVIIESGDRAHAVRERRHDHRRAGGAEIWTTSCRAISPRCARRSSLSSAETCRALSMSPTAIRRCITAANSAPAAEAALTCIRPSMPTRSACAHTADFIANRFFPRMQALATCEGQSACRDPLTDRMTFVDSHQAALRQSRLLRARRQRPAFRPRMFLATRAKASRAIRPRPPPIRSPAITAPRDFRAYAPRARWIRTANDSYFTAMTFPEGISAALQPSDLHDATWGATSAVYGGAVHPTAEGHAAMADAALPAVRGLLELQTPPQVRAEPLAPLQLPQAPSTR